MADGDVKLLYILGRGRGGSTILSSVLGELDGFFSAGEVRTLWEPVVLSGGRCGCGQVVDSCEVWSRAIKDVDPWVASRLQRDVVRENDVQAFVSLRNRGRFTAQDALARVMGGVYRSLAEVTGARVIVDSSKRPSYGAFLRSLPGVSVHYLHLVRDPRASAHSWKQRRHESATSGAEVKQRGALDSTLRWNILNLEAELLRISEAPSRFMRLRYEDFVAEPRATTQRLVAFAGERVDLTLFEDPYSVRLGPNHMIAGNPSRYTTGLVKIRDSEEWKRDQSRLDRWVTTLASVALLGRYGYRFRGGSKHVG